MAVCVNRNFDAGMAQLFRNILNRGVVFIELEGRIAVAQVMNPVSPQPRPRTNPPVDKIETGGH